MPSEAAADLLSILKNSLAKGVKIMKNTVDCILWFEIEKTFFEIQDDYYFCFVYVAPDNSPVYDIYDFDIFDMVESDSRRFSEMGRVFIFGDMNARVDQRSDFIVNDGPLLDITDQYDMDRPLSRVSSDNGSNRFGERLLDLCKSLNVRIMNGRIGSDQITGSFTCYTHNGESVVDYLITMQENFDIISSFYVEDFTIHSNHAPISSSFRTQYLEYEAQPHTYTSYKWDESFRDNFLQAINKDINSLCNDIQNNIENDCDTDTLVAIFTEYLTSRGNNYFKKTHTAKKNHFKDSDKEDKKWFDSECKKRKHAYENALRKYNDCMSVENRKYFYQKRMSTRLSADRKERHITYNLQKH